MTNTTQTDKGEQGEDFVNKIAFNSFLKHWCFPGPLDILGDNKEICDLLIVFDSICVITSVKNYSFQGDYSRYFRKTIDKASRQIIGAEKKLFSNQIVLLKHPDRNAEEFPKNKIKNIYRIIVNINPTVKYYRTSYNIMGKNFTVMDSIAWQTSLEELNTLPDFINYLESRCALFREHPAFILPREESDFSQNDGVALSNEIDEIVVNTKKEAKITIVSGNELDLIATYIKHGFKFPTELNHSDINFLTMKIDNEWFKFKESKLNQSKNSFEKESYFIDGMVKEMLIDKVNGDKLAKMFYRLDRFERAQFAKEYLDYHRKNKTSKQNISIDRTHVRFKNMNMVFIYFIDNFPLEDLKSFVELSLVHHGYLHDFKCEEVGLLAVSSSLDSFVFGYMQDYNVKEKKDLQELTMTFKELGWKIKNEA